MIQRTFCSYSPVEFFLCVFTLAELLFTRYLPQVSTINAKLRMEIMVNFGVSDKYPDCIHCFFPDLDFYAYEKNIGTKKKVMKRLLW